MKKTTKKDTFLTAAYVLAITAARDSDATQEQDKEVLAKIRDYLNQFIAMNGGNPHYTILATAGMSEEEGLAISNDFDKEEE